MNEPALLPKDVCLDCERPLTPADKRYTRSGVRCETCARARLERWMLGFLWASDGARSGAERPVKLGD